MIPLIRGIRAILFVLVCLLPGTGCMKVRVGKPTAPTAPTNVFVPVPALPNIPACPETFINAKFVVYKDQQVRLVCMTQTPQATAPAPTEKK